MCIVYKSFHFLKLYAYTERRIVTKQKEVKYLEIYKNKYTYEKLSIIEKCDWKNRVPREITSF